MSNDHDNVVVFHAGSLRFGINVDVVQRVIPACEISPLPGAPASVSGIVTIDGEVVPVVDSSVPFRADMPARLAADSRFLLVKSPLRTLAYIADAVDGVLEIPQSALTAVERLPSGMSQISDVASRLDGLIYIFNPEGLLSPSDEVSLGSAISRLQQ